MGGSEHRSGALVFLLPETDVIGSIEGEIRRALFIGVEIDEEELCDAFEYAEPCSRWRFEDVYMME